MRRIDVVYGLIINENKEKVLMVKNRRGDSYDYSLPGGAVEEGETLEEAVIREVREETGLEVEAGGILAVNGAFFEKNGRHPIFFTFSVTVKGGSIHLSRPHEILDIMWVPLEKADQFMPYYKGGISSLVSRRKEAIYFYQGRTE
ncbi:8-oxo-dGTP diphosphatase [Melghiribacillus thermohalophilus]|uniref:8-oxo-dGTP diphosphatase n=1 Tax=Melghiribacillus thermohalophilus TaxID=1324956 RepID=A0A4R3N323_9BACI|nr:NUDIX hydrolase [Melghiribacillus thermohalophilus]TCT22376.1 8-oxo-dGTP diphosphatase [Melghiribacillus thermohalophilus]